MPLETRCELTVFFQIATRQSAPKATPTSGQNVNTTLRKDNEDLKRQLCEVDTLITKTMKTLEEVRAKHRKFLCSDGSEKEN